MAAAEPAAGRQERLRRWAGEAVAAVAWAAFVFLLLYGLVFCVEAVLAEQRASQVPLPPPTSMPVVWPLMVVASLVGVGRTRRAAFVTRDIDFDVLHLVAATLGLLGISLLFHDYGFHDNRFVDCVTEASTYDRQWRNTHEHCDRAYPVASKPLPDRESLLAAGHRACDWLRAQPWGEPPTQRDSGVYFGNRYSLALSYTRHLEDAGWTPEERLDEQVALTAWFNLCPFQGWIHNQIGGGNE